MDDHNPKIPNPKELEKEIAEFLSKKFGDHVKIVSPIVFPEEFVQDQDHDIPAKEKKINFDLLPQDLIAFLDQYIIKQDRTKIILATKICTHFNRIKRSLSSSLTNSENELMGHIKNNVLMIGPTGVGKTYMVKLIAKKIGVPFVKGDATKFSETGYVGGDVEDLVRDLLREADGDIEVAQYGIIYIDEIDKIASNHNIIGADISRTGVQRALLKPMEETDVELKVPHDPISMIQEIERFRRTGKRDKRVINTKNILFIMSGAFSELDKIVKKRLANQNIGFGASILSREKEADFLKFTKAEDLVTFGFESEFVGRLPIKAVFERLSEEDLFTILKNPNNPIILGKKQDFAAYGITVKFEETALSFLAKEAYSENTGARGLVSAIERALLLFESKLPSTQIRNFPVTLSVVQEPDLECEKLLSLSDFTLLNETFEKITFQEQTNVSSYINSNKKMLMDKYGLALTPSRISTVAEYYSRQIIDIGKVIQRIKTSYDDVKKIELFFFKNFDINIVLEEDAIDYIIEQLLFNGATPDNIYKRFVSEFKDGFRLIREKTGKNRFFLTKAAFAAPEIYLNNLIKSELRKLQTVQNHNNKN